MIRILDWKYFLLIAVFGFLVSEGFYSSVFGILSFFISISFYFGFSFSINNCFDLKEDKLKKSKNPLIKNKLSLRRALIFSYSLGILGLLFSLYNIGASIIFFSMILLSYLYSAEPVRLKSKFVFDLLSHGMFFGALIFLYSIIFFSGSINYFHALAMFFIFYSSVIIEMMHNHLRDYKTDKKSGLKTTACVLGYQKSNLVVKGLLLFYPLFLVPILFAIHPLSLLLLFFGYFIYFFSGRKPFFNFINFLFMSSFLILVFFVI